MDNIRLKILCFIAVVLYTVSAFSQFAVDNNIKYRIDKETKTASIVGLYDKKIKSKYDLNIPKYIEVGSAVYEVISIENRAFYGDYNLKSVSFVEDTANIANSYQEILFDFTNSLSPFTNYTTSGEGEWINAYSTAKADGYDNATQKTIAGTYYLVSPAISLAEFSNAYVDYSYILRDNCDDGNQQLLISTSFDSRVPTSGWKVLNQSHTEGTDWTTFVNTEVQIPDEYMGRTIYLAFRYNTDSKSSSTWEIKSIKVSDGNDDENKQAVTSIENGGFETWVDDQTPENWKTASSAGNATLSQSTDAHSGSCSVCVAGTTSANKRLGYKEIYLEAGVYTMTFYAKAESAEASVRSGFVPVTNGTAGTYVYGEYTNEISANEWTKVTHEFTIEKKTNLSLVIMNSKTPGGNVLIDDVTLAKHPSMSSFNENQKNHGYVGESAFENCSSLISVEIPNGVTSIGNCAFYQCHRLTSVTIPSSVVSIENGAFSSCNRLTSLEIPNGVTSIANNAFSGCCGLTSVTIPNSVTSIEYNAFYNCSSLTSVAIPNSVVSIGGSAFYNCSSVTSITWDSNVSPHCLTQYCKENLKTIVLGDSMTIIGNSAFSGCNGLTSIEIPNTVTDIGDYAFSGCSSLTSLKLPNTVVCIGSSAFRDCSGLIDVNIPDLVTNIGSCTFYNCCSLTSIDIPSTVDTIGRYAFYNCNSLNSITIPNDVDSIVDYTFSGCNGLNNINIGTSVKYISSTAFENCESIDNVYVNMPKPISVDTKAFDAIRLDGWYLAVLYVPIGTKDMYQLISPWKYFYKIEEYDPTAGIENVKMDVPKGENVYYNLNGQRVNNPTNGIFILNGKKVLTK